MLTAFAHLARRHLAVLSILALALTLAAGSAAAQTKPQQRALGTQPKSFLFVGNSFFYYNNSMHSVFLDIVRATDPAARAQYRATSATISGSGFNWHDVDAYLRPGGGMASYSFVENNQVVFNKFDKPFDVVILNDCSQCPIHPQLSGLFHEYAKKHADTVRKYGGVPVLFMTWAYADKPEMIVDLAEQYTRAGNANNALVVPAGLAFQRALAKQPDLRLHVEDKRHPTLAGTYLAAATLYAALYGKSPIGTPVPAGIDAELGAVLQATAWETVQAYYQP